MGYQLGICLDTVKDKGQIASTDSKETALVEYPLYIQSYITYRTYKPESMKDIERAGKISKIWYEFSALDTKRQLNFKEPKDHILRTALRCYSYPYNVDKDDH
jgi:hypothetical protein